MRLALVVVLVALVAVPSAVASEEHPTSLEVQEELFCADCNTTLAEANALWYTGEAIGFIIDRIAAGDTKSEIKAALVDQFGQAVLAVPPKRGFELVAWLLPLAGLALGAVVVGLLAWRWSHARGGDEPPEGGEPLDPELERRLDDELAHFET